MNSKTKKLSGSRIGIFGKGGSGKSTVTVLLARALRKRGYEVCVVDADSTNVGLHQALGLDKSPESLVDYFGGMVFSGGAVTCPVDDPTPLSGAQISVDELPSRFVGRTEEGIWVVVTGKIGERGPGAGCDGPMAKVARDLRVRVNGEECLTLLDFKAGFEDSARGVVVGLDQIVVVVDPTSAALQMAIDMTELVDRIREGEAPATAHLVSSELVEMTRRLYQLARVQRVLVALNRVGPEASRYLVGRLGSHGLHASAAIRVDPSVSFSWLTGSRLEAEIAEIGIEDLASALEAEDLVPREDVFRVPVPAQVTY